MTAERTGLRVEQSSGKGSENPNRSDNLSQQVGSLWQDQRLDTGKIAASLPSHMDFGNVQELFKSSTDQNQPKLMQAAKGSVEKTRTEKPEATDKAATATSESSLAYARDRVRQDAEKKLHSDPHALEAFKQNLDQFEKRSNQLPENQIRDTLNQVSRLMEQPSSVVDDKTRVAIATQVMDRAAHPAQSNQGYSTDCVAASIENRLFTRSPADATRMLADVALTGSYTDHSGRTVPIDHDTVARHWTKTLDETEIGYQAPRSQADQILQATIRNIHLDRLNKTTEKPGMQPQNLRYSIGKPTRDNLNGEYTFDYGQTPPSDESQNALGQGMSIDAAETVYNCVTGSHDTGIAIGFTPHSIDRKPHLQQFLQQANERNEYPIVVGVNAAVEPFKTLMHMPVPDGVDAFAGHAITIESYNASTGDVQYRNSWDGSRSHHIQFEDLYGGMLQYRSDGDITSQAQSWNSDKPSSLDVYWYLTGTVPSERQSVANRLSSKTNTDLVGMLSDSDRQELQITSKATQDKN
jgi:hypothetical protein